MSEASTRPARLSADFWKFFTGQTISNLGSSITQFALPLLIYKLTGSALNLALGFAATFIPYLLFGLIIGAWVDRTNRKRLMIAVDLLNGVVIATIPLLYIFGSLPIWWIYVVGFTVSSLTICFHAAEFAAIPSLVGTGDLVTANGRIQASYAAATVIGPLLAGLLISVIPIHDLLLLDAASFVFSALMLALIKISFNAEAARERGSLLADIGEGLRYVWGHPVLRNISIMMALVNMVGTTVGAQLVLFVSRQYGAADSQVGIFYSAGSAGVVLLSLLAGPLRKRWGFSKVALSALMLAGLVTIAMAFTRSYWLGLLLWALQSGLGILFNINTSSLRQAIVPGHLLGRVISVAMVLAWSANPLGTLIGGWVIERSGNVAMVYAVIGMITFLIPLAFSFSALGRAERYIPEAAAAAPVPGH